MTGSPSTTTIAIVGGGIAGLASAISLQRLPNVSVHLFEQASELREVGASIALGPNGLRGLEEMGVGEALGDDVGFRSDHGIPHIFQHWKTGEVLATERHSPGVTESRHHTSRFYRPHLVQVLASHIPSDKLHLGKRLVGIKFSEDTDGATGKPILQLEDEEFIADLVVGADGIKSRIRQSYLSDFEIQPTGQISLRAVFPISRLADLGISKVENTVHTIGPDRMFFSSALVGGLFTIVTSKFEDVSSPDWHPTIRAIVSRTENLRVYPSYGAPEVPEPIWRGRVVLVGDSFHPYGGAFAAGGGMAIDDAVALYLSLSHTEGDLGLALKLYESTRRPHVERVTATVNASRANAGRWKNDEQIREWARARQDGYGAWVHEHDVHEAFKIALSS